MKYIEKKRFGKKQIISLALAASLVLFLVLSILITNALNKSGDSTPKQDPPEIITGEAIKNGMALAYPEIEVKTKISFINIKKSVDGKDSEFGFYYDKDEKCHVLYYVDSNGDVVPYFPEIYYQDSSFVYSSLFATQTLSGVQVTLVDYLCYALQSPVFDERIPFEEVAEKQEQLLREFGLSDGKYTTISFSYVDGNENEINRTIKIGEKSVTGTGYYFTVTDDGVERPYIYSSLSNYFEYALSNMTKFVKPMIVSPGLSTDKGQGPYHTTDYSQWLNEMHDGSCERDERCAKEGKCGTASCTCEGGCVINTVIPDDDARIVAYIDTVSSSITSAGSSYKSTDYELFEIDLRDYARILAKYKENGVISSSYEKASYERIIRALVGKSLGDGGFAVTLASPKSIIDFSDKTTVKYDYVITAVEAIITDSADITAPGTAVGENNLIKVTYTAKLGDKDIIKEPAHAVLDLSLSGLDAGAVSALRAAVIGESLDVSFSVDYTKDNAVKKSSKYVITEIIDIYDEKDERISKINEKSKVGYRYEVWVDGICIGSATYWLDLSKIEKGSEDVKIKNALLNQKVGAVSLEFDDHNAYYEYFLSFTSYDIDKIEYFITGELVLNFEFRNASERDPYYGESLFENILEDERKLYGLNAGACETLVKVLGGLSDETSTGTAAGLVGDEVVAIGLTPELMKEKNLYDYTIYFELPRGIMTKPSDDPNEMEDVEFSEQLGFTIYVSRVDPDTNTRYIASDLYDVITRVPAADFAFLYYDFETFWARRHLIYVEDVAYVETLSVEFYTSDYTGRYEFGIIPHTDSNRVGVTVTPIFNQGETFTANKLIEFINDPAYSKYVNYEGGVSLNDFYMLESGADPTDSATKTLGESSFRDIFLMFNYTTYVNLLSDEERAEAPDEDDLVMKMTLKMDPDEAPKSPYLYVYKFYRIDDRRVRVSIHQEDADGAIRVSSVSDFYLSSYSFKKIASCFISLLNAEIIDINKGYMD